MSVQNYNVANQAGVNYTWSISGGGTISSNGNNATVNWTTTGTYNIIVHPADACGSGINDTITATVTSTPLSFNLLSFNGFIKNHQSFLKWTTASESANTFFDLERSNNSNAFNLVSTIKGNGPTALLQDYNYVDDKPFDGNNFYRLREFDMNGNVNYSNTILLSNIYDKSLTVAPNPAVNSITLITTINYSFVRITDVWGRIVMLEQNETTLELSAYRAGIYFLQLLDADKSVVASAKFLKQ